LQQAREALQLQVQEAARAGPRALERLDAPRAAGRCRPGRRWKMLAAAAERNAAVEARRKGRRKSRRPRPCHSGYLRLSFSVSFFISVIYKFLCKIFSSISHFSLTTFSKSRSLYMKPYIRNVFCSKFLYVRIYHISNAMDIFYFYLIQCLKRKEKIEKRRENLYRENL
jgi:hypothetical protein